MIYGIGYAKIQLCDQDGIEQYAYELDGKEQAGLAQVQDPEDTDTEGIEPMDNGDRVKIISGYNVRIQIPIRVVDDITPSAWATFVNRLRGWTDRIKVTPYIDKLSYTYWVLLDKGRSFQRPEQTRNLLKITVLQFVGEERISSIS